MHEQTFQNANKTKRQPRPKLPTPSFLLDLCRSSIRYPPRCRLSSSRIRLFTSPTERSPPSIRSLRQRRRTRLSSPARTPADNRKLIRRDPEDIVDEIEHDEGGPGTHGNESEDDL